MRRIVHLLFVAFSLTAAADSAAAQGNTRTTYSLGIYVPTAPFASSDRVRAHANALGKAIEARAKVNISVRVFFRYADLLRARPHLAVLESRCAATQRGATILASAVVRGATSERWGLYSSRATAVPKLKGGKIVHVPTGCVDKRFMAHTLLHSELPLSFFGPRISRRTARLAATATAKDTAVAAFLPASVAGGLKRIYDAGSVPGPALVALRPLPGALKQAIIAAASAFTSGTAITGYRGGGGSHYKQLAAALKRRTKRPIFAAPKNVRVNAAAWIQLPIYKRPTFSVSHLVR